MTFKRARFKIAVAGRELGSGPLVVVERICPGMIDELTEREIAKQKKEKANWERRLAEGQRHAAEILATFADRLDEKKIRNQQQRLIYGVAVGLVMAEDPAAMQVLDEIYQEWRRNS